jgi:hypothetical protein
LKRGDIPQKRITLFIAQLFEQNLKRGKIPQKRTTIFTAQLFEQNLKRGKIPHKKQYSLLSSVGTNLTITVSLLKKSKCQKNTRLTQPEPRFYS